MGLRISPEIIRKDSGSNSFCFCPEARIERLIRSTIQEADEHGLNGVDIAMEHYGIGTRYGDLLALFRVDRRNGAWASAAKRTGHRVPRLFARRGAKAALSHRAREENRSERELLDELLQIAVLLAWSRRSEAQRIRLGWAWVKDRYGSIAMIAPNTPWLLLDEFEQWFHKEIRNALQAILLDTAYPKTTGDALDQPRAPARKHLIHVGQPDLTAGPGVRARQPKVLERLPDILSPREQDVYFLLKDDPDSSGVELGERLGLAPSTVRVLLLRIRAKANKLLAAM